MLGRVEMERRSPAGEGDLRNDVLPRGDEGPVIACSASRIVVLQQRPEPAPGIAVRHRAAFPEFPVKLERTVEGFRQGRIEITGHRGALIIYVSACKVLSRPDILGEGGGWTQFVRPD